MSINEGTDLAESDKHYPPVDLPTAQDLCELAETQRAVFQPLGEDLAGATIDISDAYRQFTVSTEAIMHRTVMVTIKKVRYIVFALTGWFGDTRAGHCYNLTGSYIDHQHNHKDGRPLETKRSVLYVDDATLMDGKSVLENSRAEYRGFARDMHGPTAISADKDISSGQDIISTGWHIIV
jgi:hypothetical protein